MITKAPKTLSSNREVEYPHFVIEKFSGIHGKLVSMHPEDISKNFGKILKEAGLPPFRFHDLWHPYVKPTTKKFITFFEVFRAAS